MTDGVPLSKLQIVFTSGLRRGMQDGRKVGGIVSGASYFNGGSRHEQEICLLIESEAEFYAMVVSWFKMALLRIHAEAMWSRGIKDIMMEGDNCILQSYIK